MFKNFGDVEGFAKQLDLLKSGSVPLDTRDLEKHGGELECALVDRRGILNPIATQVIDLLAELPPWTRKLNPTCVSNPSGDYPLMVHEAALYSIEHNMPPCFVRPGSLFAALEQLKHVLALTNNALNFIEPGSRLCMMGYNFARLVSGDHRQFISPGPRYLTLSERIPQYYGDSYWDQNFFGERLTGQCLAAVMGRSNSYQASIQVAPENAVRVLQAILAASPMLALLSQNAPLVDGYVSGKYCMRSDVWNTLIGGGIRDLADFGPGAWLPEGGNSLLEYLERNLMDMPCIFDPNQEELESPPTRLAVLMLAIKQLWHNARITLRHALDDQGKPIIAVVIEVRMLPSGPSPENMMANHFACIAGALGILEIYGTGTVIPYDVVRRDYDDVNWFGHEAKVTCFDGVRRSAIQAAEKFIELVRIGASKLQWSQAESDWAIKLLYSTLRAHGFELPLTGSNYVLELWRQLDRKVPEGERGAMIARHFARWGLSGPLHSWPNPHHAAEMLTTEY